MKISFLSLNSIALLTNENLGYTGGAELQQVLLGKELNKNGYDITFITYDENIIKNKNIINNIKIIKCYERNKSTKYNLIQKLLYIKKALNDSNSDIYFYSSGSPGIISLYSKIMNKKYVYRMSSDSIFTNKSNYFLKICDISDIKNATKVVAQTEYQKKMLLKNYSINSTVIKNAIPLKYNIIDKSKNPIILWVATLAKHKRPEIFLKIAQDNPDINFEMIGGTDLENKYLYNNIKIQSENIFNLKFHGFIPYNKIDQFFEKSWLLLNTSEYEGFPNTFLQAWNNQTPVLTLNIDPDKVITKYKLGYCCKSINEMGKNIRYLITNEKERKNQGKNAKNYIEKEHSIKEMVIKYMKIFDSIS